MRSSRPLCSPGFTRVFLTLCALLCALPSFGQTLTFTGQVYSPLGPPVSGSSAAHGDPIPNILVFIEDPNSPLPVFSPGLTIPSAGQSGCAVQPALVPSTVLGSAITDPTGTYTFNVAGSLPSTLTVVVQAGKWRRQYQFSTAQIAGYTSGSKVSLPALSMPASSGTLPDGTIADLPHIAVVTGSADEIECIFPQIGISTSEVTDPTGKGSINFFTGNGGAGEEVSASTPTETQLVNPSATGAIPLTNYDLVIFGCQGPSGRTDADAAAYAENVVSYANTGGRVFATHWEYSWIQDTVEWSPLISFSTSTSTQSVTTTGQLSTSYAGEPTLAAWMKFIGALDVNPSLLEFTLTAVFYENILAVNAPAQTWVTLPNYSNSASQVSFDTPIGAAGTPTAILNFTNNQSTFLRGDQSDSIVVNVSNNSNTPTLGGLTLSLSIPSNISPASLVDSSGGSWNCTLSLPKAVCTLPGPLAPGASDSVTLTFSIPQTATLGVSSLVGSLSNGGINQSQQCGRVLYNDYHVENSGTPSRSLFNNGARCTKPNTLTNAQKFLEYSLYNLSSFVAPANTDTLQIQQSGTITWNPPSPAYYGVTLAAIEDATVNTPGTLTYSVNPTPSAVPEPGAYNFSLNFQPFDSVDYLAGTASGTVQVLVDPTTSSITNLLTSIYYGQEIGYDPVQGDAALNTLVTLSGNPAYIGAQPPAGSFSATIDGKLVCSGAWPAGVTGGRCPDANFLGWPAGPHTFAIAYAGTTEFAASNASYVVTVNPDPTVTALTTTATGNSILGTNLTYSASVADSYANPVGTITFYDSASAVTGISAPTAGMTPIGSTAISGGVTSATISLAALPTGTHNILACFAAPLNAAGLPNMASSCSNSTAQAVTAIPSPLPASQTLLVSSSNPSLTGQSVTFTATVGSTGPFAITPTGTVTFLDGTTPLGTAAVAADGTAAFTTSTLALGTHSITASYAASPTLAASVSAVLTQTVISPMTLAGPGFLLIVNPTTVPVYVGSTAIVTVQIVPLTNFQQPVALTCTGLPSEAACTFALPTMPVGGGTTQLIVSSGAPHDCNGTTPYFASNGKGALPLLAFSTLTLCLARRRRKLQGLALAILLCLLPSALTGCGSGNCTDFAVKPGDYTFTVTATPGALTVTTGGSAYTTAQTANMTMHVHL